MKTVVLCLAIFGMTPILAQDQPADNMQILRDKVHADRKLVVSVNMDLTESEAKSFWPVYDDYIKDLTKIDKRMMALIESYAADYRANSLTDEKAGKLVDEALAINEAELNLKKSYVAALSKTLPAKKVARAMQIENKIRATINYALADQIPLAR